MTSKIMSKKKEVCVDCSKILKKDEIALNKKLISLDVTELRCIKCLSIDFGCEVEDLQTKIDEFKEQGCTLFV